MLDKLRERTNQANAKGTKDGPVLKSFSFMKYAFGNSRCKSEVVQANFCQERR
jgi:hypothetical protein